MTEVQKVVQLQNASPATTSDQHPSIQENFMQLESRIEARFQAFTHEVDLLREEITQSAEGNAKSVKEWAGTKLAHVTAQLRGLKKLPNNWRHMSERNVPLKAEPQPGKL